jgi:hypothetical protein
MRVGKIPDGVLARLSPAMQARMKRKKPRRRNRGLVFLVIGACLAIAGSATVLTRSWPKDWSMNFSPVLAKKDGALPQQSGHIIVSRNNSQLCDHYLFDNRSGVMTATEAQPCHKRKEVPVADHVTSFSSSWRVAR